MSISGESVAIMLGAASLLASLCTALFVLATIKTKVDTMWRLLFESAIIEGLKHGGLSRNSPVRLTDEGRSWFGQSLRNDLLAYYADEGRFLTPDLLALQVQRRFGQRLAKEIALPRGMISGAQIPMAVELMRELYEQWRPRRPEDNGPKQIPIQ